MTKDREEIIYDNEAHIFVAYDKKTDTYSQGRNIDEAREALRSAVKFRRKYDKRKRRNS